MNQSASEITVTPARDYGNEVGQGWPVVVAPVPGELLSSWLHRLAMANGIPPQYFGRVLDVAVGDWSAKLDRDLPGRILNLLVERTRLPTEDIDGLALNRDPLARLRLRHNSGSGDPGTSTAQFNRLQYCPVCLKEDLAPYFRRGWTLATRVSCFRHGCRLRDHCPTCRGGIAPVRQNRLLPQHFCVWCDADLRKPTLPAEYNVHRLERLLDDLLRMHVAGHGLHGRTSLPAMLGTVCFTFDGEPKSISRLPIRDRYLFFRQLTEGMMPLQKYSEHPAIELWTRIALAASKHSDLVASLSAEILSQITPGTKKRSGHPDLTALQRAIIRLHSNRRTSLATTTPGN
ncbi:TniQ family protein [Marinovum algicola]|uniref:TniQ family protein n=1 Tax=Marinovum algicola TaxID=42444 RepID=UPI00094241FA|nr:TniQ family protein [Marinovum algicola]